MKGQGKAVKGHLPRRVQEVLTEPQAKRAERPWVVNHSPQYIVAAASCCRHVARTKAVNDRSSMAIKWNQRPSVRWSTCDLLLL